MTKKTLIFCILWLLLATVIFYVALIINLSFNLFSWHFHMDSFVYMVIFIIILIAVCYKLAKHTKGRVEIWFSFLIAIALMIFGIFVLVDFYSESVSSGFFARHTLSPHWFRITTFAIYLTAIIFWLIYPLNYLKKGSASVLK